MLTVYWTEGVGPKGSHLVASLSGTQCTQVVSEASLSTKRKVAREAKMCAFPPETRNS
jgi:hypothetical protein